MICHVEKLPKDVICRLFAIAMASSKRKKRENPTDFKTFKVKCKLMSSDHGRPEGDTLKIAIRSTDTVGYIRYLLVRELNGHTSSRRMKIKCNDVMLSFDDELVSNTSISASTGLKIY